MFARWGACKSSDNTQHSSALLLQLWSLSRLLFSRNRRMITVQVYSTFVLFHHEESQLSGLVAIPVTLLDTGPHGSKIPPFQPEATTDSISILSTLCFSHTHLLPTFFNPQLWCPLLSRQSVPPLWGLDIHTTAKIGKHTPELTRSSITGWLGGRSGGSCLMSI